MLFLLLVPTTIILAENASSNITGNMLANLSLQNSSLDQETAAGSPVQANATQPENATSPPAQPPDSSANQVLQANETGPGLNLTVPEVNLTDSTPPSGNETNQTIPVNSTLPGQNNSNTTLSGKSNESLNQPVNETQGNHSLVNQTLIPEVSGLVGPDLEVTLDVPDRSDRNQPFRATASISNNGDQDATGVEVEWILPQGIEIVEGESVRMVSVPVGYTARVTLLLEAGLNSRLGEREIEVIVRYLR